jgi:hypothetical protein
MIHDRSTDQELREAGFGLLRTTHGTIAQCKRCDRWFPWGGAAPTPDTEVTAGPSERGKSAPKMAEHAAYHMVRDAQARLLTTAAVQANEMERAKKPRTNPKKPFKKAPKKKQKKAPKKKGRK